MRNLKQRIKLSFLLHKRIEISLLADCSILHDKDFIIAAKNRFLKAMRYDDSCHSNQIQYGKLTALAVAASSAAVASSTRMIGDFLRSALAMLIR